jgi:uncharacterized protein YjiS (DUF1127 family)
VAKKDHLKRTAEEKARWRENQERLDRLVDRALADLGMTREEFRRRHNMPPPHGGRR